jgi:hypothetical protein
MRNRRIKCLASTFRAGKGTLDLHLEGENHLYNKKYIKTGIFSGTVPEPGNPKGLPSAPIQPRCYLYWLLRLFMSSRSSVVSSAKHDVKTTKQI